MDVNMVDAEEEVTVVAGGEGSSDRGIGFPAGWIPTMFRGVMDRGEECASERVNGNGDWLA